MSDPKCAQVLLEAAERDVQTLRSMSKEAPDESFGFHVQQAVEKALKAWLALLGQVYPLRHDLDDLFDLLDSRGVSTGFYRELAEFTPYAVQFRYEGLGPEHDPIDREAGLARAGALVRHVRDLLGTSGSSTPSTG